MMTGAPTIRNIVQAERLLHRNASEGRPLAPMDFRAVLLVAVKVGMMDHWEAWKRLYNAGFRGRLLNDFNHVA